MGCAHSCESSLFQNAISGFAAASMTRDVLLGSVIWKIFPSGPRGVTQVHLGDADCREMSCRQETLAGVNVWMHRGVSKNKCRLVYPSRNNCHGRVLSTRDPRIFKKPIEYVGMDIWLLVLLADCNPEP